MPLNSHFMFLTSSGTLLLAERGQKMGERGGERPEVMSREKRGKRCRKDKRWGGRRDAPDASGRLASFSGER